MTICAMFDRLNASQKNAIDIDYLTAAAHCKDVYKIAGLITETYTRVKGMETAMRAAQESPGIMAKFAKHAKTSKGFNHGKLILQTTGVAPVPRNQTTVMIGNKIDNSKNQMVVVPRPEEIATVVDQVMSQLNPPEFEAINVPSGNSQEEDSGDRDENEDETD
jgi:hypothetical protein